MDKKAIREELNQVKVDIRQLKKEFSKKRDEKEGHFKKGEDFSTEINTLYDEIKKIELENNLEDINKELDVKQAEHASLKEELNQLEAQFKNEKNTKTEVQKPQIKTISVEKAQKEIKSLDLKLQTQVLSLDKESEVIKKIQELKGQISSVIGSDDDENSGDSSDIKKKLNSVKRKFNNTEKKIRNLYKQIRIISKEKKKRYKQIDDLRDQKKKAFEEFRDKKKDYSKTSNELKGHFKKETDLLEQLGESPVQVKKKNTKDIKQKRKEIEKNFLEKGSVLTTEDLMMFQKN